MQSTFATSFKQLSEVGGHIAKLLISEKTKLKEGRAPCEQGVNGPGLRGWQDSGSQWARVEGVAGLHVNRGSGD